MRTPNMTEENFKKLSAMFPNAVTETVNENGEIVHAIDADILQQEISGTVIAGGVERYQFTWPDKKKSVVLANQPINKTLRLDREKSFSCDGTSGSIDTENIYIEGDNLEALKLLQETYLGKIKMIYIDPPYNTGNDFIYEDDFSKDVANYTDNSGQTDDDGNRLVQNTESNGRFHTDWLNMIYSRLKIAKDLLSDDGVIFISIDDGEVDNLKKICAEIFGQSNFIAQSVRRTINSGKHDTSTLAVFHEYVLMFCKNIQKVILNKKTKDEAERKRLYKETDEYEKERGKYYITQLNKNSLQYSDGLNYPIKGPDGIDIWPGNGFDDKSWIWRWSKNKVQWGLDNGYIVFKKSGQKYKVYTKSYEFRDIDGNPIIRNNPYSTLEFVGKEYGNFNATPELEKLFDGRKIFDFPKSTVFIKELIKLANVKENEIVLDFFSGSATTADALLKQETEDGINRKFIMIQLPATVKEKSEAYRFGYRNISEIGEERIRRVGKKIREEHPDANLDIGFRVFKVDSSNMKDVYYKPDGYDQGQIDLFADNIKEDRTPEDLLFQVMLDLGISLSSKIEESVINDKKVFVVGGEYTALDGSKRTHLIACFDKDITDDTVKAIAEKHPSYAVFRDSCMANDSVATNFEQIFETYSPDTVRKVL